MGKSYDIVSIPEMWEELSLDERRKVLVELVGKMPPYELGRALLDMERKHGNGFLDAMTEYRKQKQEWVKWSKQVAGIVVRETGSSKGLDKRCGNCRHIVMVGHHEIGCRLGHRTSSLDNTCDEWGAEE